MHFLEWALERTRLDLSHGRQPRRGAAAVADGHGEADGCIGHGWLEAGWPDGAADGRGARRPVTGERPAALWAHDHHTLWVNSAALRAAGVAASDRRAAGMGRVAVPAAAEPTAAERAKAVRDGMAEANARGVVCVHDFQRDGGREVWQRLRRRPPAAAAGGDVVPARRARRGAATLELRTGFGGGMLRVGPVKAFMDGTLGSRTAWMLDGSGDQLLSRGRAGRGRAPRPPQAGSRSPSTPSATARTARR